MAENQKSAPDNDKSINDLLKEYAGDVKDKDLDDFLKSSDEDEDAFEAATSDDDDDDEVEALAPIEPRKHASGLVTMLLIVIAFGAAGAGAYVYLNRDEGMTAIMGGFSGTNEEAVVPAPPPSADTATATPSEMAPPPAMPDAPAQPMPIVNEPAITATPSETPMSMPAPVTETAAAPSATPAGADLLSVPVTAPETPATAPAPVATATPQPITPPASAPVMDKLPTPEPTPIPAPIPEMAPAPAASTPAQPLPPAGDATAATAVDAWASGVAPTPPANTDAKAALPEKPVAEVKAKAVPAPKQARAKEPLISSAEKKTPSAPKESKYLTMTDGALPPPYVAIQQAKKNGTSSAAVAAPAKMAPVLESTGRDTDGNTNKNVSDVTHATGDTAAMVANGGGKIELPGIPATRLDTTDSNGVPMPVGMMKAVPARPQEPELRDIPLAINGGKSVPPGAATVQTRAYAQIPDTDEGTKPAPAAAPAPAPEPEVLETPRAPEAAAPVASADTSSPSSSDSTSARAILAQAQQAEKEGDNDKALTLYQRALEADAVYGDGKSIDRGAVYDRIGAIRAGR